MNNRFRNTIRCILLFSISVCALAVLLVMLWNNRYSNNVMYPDAQQIENCFNDHIFERIESDSCDIPFCEKFSQASDKVTFSLKAKRIEKHIKYDYLFEYQGVGYRLISFDFADGESAKTIFTSFVTEAKANIYKNTKVINPFEIPRKRQFAHYYTNGDLSGPSTQIWYDSNIFYLLLSGASEDESSIQTASNIKKLFRGG